MSKIITPGKAKISLLDRDIVYLPSPMIQTTLPHRDPEDLAPDEYYTRRSGNVSLTIVPGVDSNGRSLGYPFGVIPRCANLWLSTAYGVTKERRIVFDENFNEFIRDIGLNPDTGTGERGDVTRAWIQLMRLFKCTISITGFNGGQESWKNMHIASEGRLWWDSSDIPLDSDNKNWITLSQSYADLLETSRVPLNMDALRKLKHCAMAMDLYCLLTWKSNQVLEHGGDGVLKWRWLHSQIGSGLKRQDNFAAAVDKTLREHVIDAYPEVRIQRIRGGIQVLPNTKTSVPQSSLKIIQEVVREFKKT